MAQSDSIDNSIPQSEMVMLVVGTVPARLSAPTMPPTADGGGDRIHFAAFEDVTRCLLDRLKPEIVVSALMGSGFDVLDLAHRLHELGFNGRYRAVTAPLPNPKIVRREIAAVAPGLDVDLLIIGAGGIGA